MARIKNDLLKLTGSMGGMSFSQDEFGTIVKGMPKKTKKQVKTNPRSQRTRESNMEMGAGSAAAKVLRLSFLRGRKGLEDRYFSGRLSGVMRKVVALGAGKSGERKLDIRENGSLLKEFEFINARPLVYSVGGIKEEPTLNAGRNEVYWTSPTLNRKEQITALEGATHFSFKLCAATVSNYEYNARQNKYLPLEPKHHSLSGLVESEPIDLKHKTITPISLRLKLAEDTVLPDEVAVVSAVGVAFYRNVNGELLEVKDSLAMRVLGVG